MAEETWHSELPSELGESVSKFGSVEELAKGYVNAEQGFRSSIRIPTSDAGDEQWGDFKNRLTEVPGVVMLPGDDDESRTQFYTKLGRPDEPAGYEIDNPEFTKIAHDLGLSKDQAAGINEAMTTVENQEAIDRSAKVQTGLAELQQEWGQQFEQKGRQAHQALAYLDQQLKADGELIKEMNQPGVGDSALVIKALAHIGTMLGESKIGNVEVTSAFRMTPGEAQERVNDIMADVNGPYHNAGHPNHQNTVDKVQRLLQVVHPE